MTTNEERPDRDDELIDRMLAGEPAASEAEAEARVPYEQVVKRLREFDDATLPAGWEEQASLRLRAARAREARAARRPWLIGGAAAVAIAAAVLFFVSTRRDKTSTPQPAVRRGAGAGVVGETRDFRPAATGSGGRRAHVELRLYLEDTLVARCPGEPGCGGPDGLTLRHLLRASGRYQSYLFESDAPLPAPQDGGLDTDMQSALRSGARVHREETVRVTP